MIKPNPSVILSTKPLNVQHKSGIKKSINFRHEWAFSSQSWHLPGGTEENSKKTSARVPSLLAEI
jgi:hypothetical protein